MGNNSKQFCSFYVMINIFILCIIYAYIHDLIWMIWYRIWIFIWFASQRIFIMSDMWIETSLVSFRGLKQDNCSWSCYVLTIGPSSTKWWGFERLGLWSLWHTCSSSEHSTTLVGYMEQDTGRGHSIKAIWDEAIEHIVHFTLLEGM